MYVRSMKENDKDEFLRLSKEFYSSGATRRGYDKDMSEKTFFYLMQKHENLWGYLLLDKDRQDAIGYALITAYWCNEDGGNVIVLDELFIGALDRNKGYAKQFIKWLEEEFKEKAVSITLEVVTTNTAAKKLYAGEGYVEDGFQILSKRLKN